MNIVKKINVFRRKITRLITYNIGKSTVSKNKVESLEKNSVVRILITRPNHRLGNMLLITPIVQESIDTFPNAKIDLFVKGTIANSVFENYDEIDKIIALPKQHFKNFGHYLLCWYTLKRQQYDIVINCIENSSSGKLSTKFARAKIKYYGTEFNADVHDSNNEEEIKHLAKNTIFGFRYFLSNLGIVSFNNEIPKLDIKLSKNEIEEGRKILNNLTKNEKETIAIFTYATGEKCYSEEWWNTLYELLKLNFPDYNIVEILPAEKVSNINYQALSFYSRDIRQISSIIANTTLFIGADSGMMHLASASQTTTIGLFSVTNAERYKPYGNGSFAIDTNNGNFDDYINSIKNVLNK